MRFLLRFLLIAALTGATLSAQVSTGTPPFSSIGGGPFDQINLGNLNVHFTVPVLQKAGRGVPFNFDLGYDSSIWYPVTSSGTTTWEPSNSWGWTSSFAAIMGNIEMHGSLTTVFLGSCTTTSYTKKNIVYIDVHGTSHPFAGSATATYRSHCTLNNGWAYGPNLNSIATDGSGLRLSASSDPYGTNTVTNLAGQTVGFSGFTSTTSINPYQDQNGNYVTYNSSTGQFFDTLSSTTPVITTGGSGTSSSPTTYTYTPPSGGSGGVYTVSYRQYTVATAFGFSTIHEYGPTSVALVNNIVLPDGTQYTFSYEQTPGSCTPLGGTYLTNCVTGRIAQVTLPMGGTVSYVYTGGTNSTGIFSDGSTAGFTRTLSPGGTWTYARSLVSGTPGPGSTWTTTVNDPSSPSNATVSKFTEDTSFTNDLYETQRNVYQGSQSPSNLLKTIVRCFNANYSNCAGASVSSPITQTDTYTVLPSGATRLSEVQFNGSSTVPGLVSLDSEYDYGVTQGAAPGITHLIEQTNTSYASLGNGIVGSPSSVVVDDYSSGSPVEISSTTYSYDQTTPTATTGTPQHATISGSRGNLTTFQQAANGSTSLYRIFSYYDTGTLNITTGPSTSSSSPGPSTTYSYGSGSCGNSFVTSISAPLSLGRSMTWNCTGGVETQVTDENSQTVTTNYTDAYFWRPANVYDQENNETTIAYSGQTATETTLKFNSNNSVADTLSTVNGFGRPILSQRLQGPSASNYDTTETDYNNVGLPSRSTMPFSASAGGTSSTAPALNTTYDALGRPLTVTDADGGTTSYTYTNNDTLETVSGTQSFKKQLEYDGLGRLTSVCEMSTTLTGVGTCGQTTTQTGYWTKYTYDALGHLLTVTQNAQAGSGHQSRSYAYDMLGRLTSEVNPEAGTTTYFWDAAPSACYPPGGGYPTPGVLGASEDNKGNYDCYGYDALNRPGGVGNTSSGNCRGYIYDSSSAVPSGVTVQNGKGRLIGAYTNSACNGRTSLAVDEWFSYSPRGELTDVYESTPHSGGYYHTSVSYWPSGSIETLSGIPSVPTLYYGASNNSGAGLDGEGRYTQVTALSGPNPVSSVAYSSTASPNPLGSLTSVTYGSSDSDSFTYDPNTGRPSTYTFSVNGSTDTGTTTWNTNGTLGSLVINDGISSSDSQSCTFAYDDLGRVGSPSGYGVNCGSKWQQSFTYDAFGNIDKSGSSSFAAMYSSSTNQFSLSGGGVSYDLDGNLLSDNLNSYTWDGYGDLASVNGITATYDALGRAVEQSSGSGYAQILYSPMGKTALMMNGTSLTKAFVGLPGGGTAVYTPSGASSVLAYYRHSDWLGSSRLTSTQSRTLYSSTAYAPFGEQYATSGTADASFTGENSDTVPSLYDFTFRRLSSSQGRWISPDPSGMAAVDPTSPQTWNRYAYVVNNPLANIDPTGLRMPSAGCGWYSNGVAVPWGVCGFSIFDPGDEGDCTLDGMSTGCGTVNDMVNAGSAALCQLCGEVVRGLQGLYFEIVADADGLGYLYGNNSGGASDLDGEDVGSGEMNEEGLPDLSNENMFSLTFLTSMGVGPGGDPPCKVGPCTYTIYTTPHYPPGNACAGGHQTNGQPAQFVSLWDCIGTVPNCKQNQDFYQDSCRAGGYTPMDCTEEYNLQAGAGSYTCQCCNYGH